jgi:hypothetical protein
MAEIRLERVTKTFKQVRAVDDAVLIEVAEGEAILA